eukprot:3439357-Pleurochrysis_carterae.AAC.1
MAAFDKYSAPGLAAWTLAAAPARLGKLSSVAAQHAYLREQIEMRVLGLGLIEHAISWSSHRRHAAFERRAARRAG